MLNLTEGSGKNLFMHRSPAVPFSVQQCDSRALPACHEQSRRFKAEPAVVESPRACPTENGHNVEATQNDIATAYYEAGQAVIAWKYHMIIGRGTLSVFNHADKSGFGQISIAKNHRRKDRAMHLMMIRLAGPTAQKFKGETSFNTHHAREDGEAVQELARQFTNNKKEARAFVILARKRTVRLVRAYWFIVDALATELLKRKELDPREARKIIMLAIGNRQKNPLYQSSLSNSSQYVSKAC